MNVKKMAVPIAILVMMVAAIFVMQAAAFTAPNANDDRVEFAYSEGNCSGLYVNERPNCTDPAGPNMTTLRVYGEDNVSAAFPYNDSEGPFDPTNPEAPGKDFVVFNPAYINGESDFGRTMHVNGVDANEKVFVRQWYVPKYPEPLGRTWPTEAPTTIDSADIVTEYSYMLLDTADNPVAGTAQEGTGAYWTSFWFPIGSRNSQIGLDSFKVVESRPQRKNELVSLRAVGDFGGSPAPNQNNPDGRKDIDISTHDSIMVAWGGSETLQFLDHRIKVRDVALSGTTTTVVVDLYYMGNDNKETIVENVQLSNLGVGDKLVAGRHTYMVPGTPSFTLPWYLEVASIGTDGVYFNVGRLLHTGETFFVDGAEYDISMIYGPEENSGEFTTFKYITIRNPTPKCTETQGDITLPILSITKTCVPSCEVMPMLPPFNRAHTVVDDINCNVDDYCNDGKACDQIDADGTDMQDRLVDVPKLEIMWLFEDVETRFHTNLLEILKETTPEIWQWIHIHIMPDQYTEIYYPPMEDSANCNCSDPLNEACGDYLLVSSWEAPNSCGDRMKFAYDALDSSDIYVNEQNECGINSVRIYGEEDVDAVFPYTDPEGPFNKLSEEAPRKDFVTFNPAYIAENDYGGVIHVNGENSNEKVFVRQWYVPKYPEPRGRTWPTTLPEPVHSADIVTEYSYMLLDIANMPVAGTAQEGTGAYWTNFWLPIGSEKMQTGLDSFHVDVSGDDEMVQLKAVGDFDRDDRKDINITTRDNIKINHVGWYQFLDHAIHVTDYGISGDSAYAICDLYYLGNHNVNEVVSSDLIGENINLEIGGNLLVAGRHTSMEGTPSFTMPWYLEVVSVGSQGVYIKAGRLLHTNETFFVDGAEYDISMIYGPEENSGEFTTFKYITIRNPTPKYNEVHLPAISIWKTPVEECDGNSQTPEDIMPMLPPFNRDHKIVDDIGIPHTCPGPFGDVIQDEPDGIDDCAGTVAERIVTNQPPFVSYFVDEDVESRFKTNLLEILDESDPEGWNMLCTWTLPWSYTAMVYPDVGDMECNGNPIKDADFIVTTSGPANYTSPQPPQPTRLEGDVTDTGLPITGADAQLVAQHIVGTTTLTGEDAQAADVNDDMGGVTPHITGADLQLIKQYIVGTISVFPGGQYIP